MGDAPKVPIPRAVVMPPSQMYPPSLGSARKPQVPWPDVLYPSSVAAIVSHSVMLKTNFIVGMPVVLVVVVVR